MTAMPEDKALDWTTVVEGSRAVERAKTWGDPDSIIQAAVRGYRRDNWQDQPTIVELWSEKSTVQGVLALVLDELGVTLRVMKGRRALSLVCRAAWSALWELDAMEPSDLHDRVHN
jgi:hypothetical protein